MKIKDIKFNLIQPSKNDGVLSDLVIEHSRIKIDIIQRIGMIRCYRASYLQNDKKHQVWLRLSWVHDIRFVGNVGLDRNEIVSLHGFNKTVLERSVMDRIGPMIDRFIRDYWKSMHDVMVEATKRAQNEEVRL